MRSMDTILNSLTVSWKSEQGWVFAHEKLSVCIKLVGIVLESSSRKFVQIDGI